jgi:hypothetical protein
VVATRETRQFGAVDENLLADAAGGNLLLLDKVVETPDGDG